MYTLLLECTTGPRRVEGRGRLRTWLTALALLLVAAFAASPARAAVSLRVESRPISSPIEAYVTVTDANGNPVGGLAAADFTVMLDGQAITIQAGDFSLPPSENPDRNVSVVFVMDYSPSTAGTPRATMQDAVVTFIRSMRPGDYAAIVKFNGDQGAKVVQEFTKIDGGAGNSTLEAAATSPYDGRKTNMYDGVMVALAHIGTPPEVLPTGPKAVIVISDGDDTSSTATLPQVTAESSRLGIPLFTIAVGSIASGQNVLNQLAARTGGTYTPAPTDGAITGAYATISGLLDNGYLLSFVSSISDCNRHTLQVRVSGETTSTDFTRCDAATNPPPPPPPPPGGSGGGGGNLGFPGAVLFGLAALAARRRRRAS